MPDPVDPPRKKKRAKRPEPDFVIDPSKPNATIELETADLLQLGQSGLVQAAVNRTRELALSDLEELREGMPIEDPKVMVDLGPDPDAPPKEQNVFVDLGPEAAVVPAAAPSPARVVVAPTEVVTRLPAPVAEPARQPRKPTPSPAAAPQLATPINVQRVTPTMPKVEVATPRNTAQLYVPNQRRSMGIVVLVYLVAAAALAASIYFRWFA